MILGQLAKLSEKKKLDIYISHFIENYISDKLMTITAFEKTSENMLIILR